MDSHVPGDSASRSYARFYQSNFVSSNADDSVSRGRARHANLFVAKSVGDMSYRLDGAGTSQIHVPGSVRSFALRDRAKHGQTSIGDVDHLSRKTLLSDTRPEDISAGSTSRRLVQSKDKMSTKGESVAGQDSQFIEREKKYLSKVNELQLESEYARNSSRHYHDLQRKFRSDLRDCMLERDELRLELEEAKGKVQYQRDVELNGARRRIQYQREVEQHLRAELKNYVRCDDNVGIRVRRIIDISKTTRLDLESKTRECAELERKLLESENSKQELQNRIGRLETDKTKLKYLANEWETFAEDVCTWLDSHNTPLLEPPENETAIKKGQVEQTKPHDQFPATVKVEQEKPGTYTVDDQDESDHTDPDFFADSVEKLNEYQLGHAKAAMKRALSSKWQERVTDDKQARALASSSKGLPDISRRQRSELAAKRNFDSTRGK
ncbi:uncharacterized protein KY384_003843 [Bacidia gigantensis]|uniref:uncharacterized protein n=1 Tax=Bacidia gigantensis TaxID=2732470 RepID=UPI001D049310|nr:uncharacterized protein KY384_003843 [Bacidia gigantensis]KAG8532202.1 hypothetical protein KY384_003843 [Bacidia gigantensis]